MYRSAIKDIGMDKWFFRHTANRTKSINVSGRSVYRGGIRL